MQKGSSHLLWNWIFNKCNSCDLTEKNKCKECNSGYFLPEGESNNCYYCGYGCKSCNGTIYQKTCTECWNNFMLYEGGEYLLWYPFCLAGIIVFNNVVKRVGRYLEHYHFNDVGPIILSIITFLSYNI